MKIGIISGRDQSGQVYENATYVHERLDTLHDYWTDPVSMVVSGGGRGPETHAVEWAEKKGIEHDKVVPKLREYGTERAFIERNRNIILRCDMLVVFWSGSSLSISVALGEAALKGKICTVFPML